MNRQFFTISEYVDRSNHISATEKTFTGRTDVHVHEFFEIEMVLDGEGKHIVNDHEYELTRGSIYLLTPGTFHSLICTPELHLINIMFDEMVLSNLLIPELFIKIPNCFFELRGRDFDDMKMLAELLIKNLDLRDEYSGVFINSIINCVIIRMVRESSLFKADGVRGKHAVLNNVMRYLYKNFGENPSLKNVAAMAGYSPNYFSKIFAEFTGKGYSEFLNALKVARAKVLLTSGDRSVSEIAFHCGFSSLSNFYRIFKEETGVTPSEYRKRSTI